MNPWLRRILGVAMVLAAIVSMLISLFFLGQIWRLRQPLTDQIVSNLDLLYSTSVTSENAILSIETMVTDLSENLTNYESHTISVTQAIYDADYLMDSSTTLAGQDLPTMLTNTQSALDSAQSSAAAIENVLYGLADNPAIGINYNPEVPLSQALEEVTSSLARLPVSLANLQRNFEITHNDIVYTEETLVDVNKNILRVNNDLTVAKGVIDEVQAEESQFKSRLDNYRTSAPGWILACALLLTFVIFWLGIFQAGMLIQGIDMLTRRYKRKPSNG
jgi:hypothetical protein